MIVLDASVLVAHLDASDAHHDRACGLLTESAAHRWAASPLTLAEVLAGPARVGRLDDAVAAINRLDVATIAFGDDAPVRLAMLRADTRLKIPDCCVLLAAEQTGAELATLDKRLASAASQRKLVVRT